MRGKFGTYLTVQERSTWLGQACLSPAQGAAGCYGKSDKSIGHPNVRLSLGRDEAFPPAATDILATVKIANRRTLAALALSPEIGFGEGYSKGQIEVQGDLVRFLEAVLASIRDANTIGWYSKLVSRWLDRAQANSLRGSVRNFAIITT